MPAAHPALRVRPVAIGLGLAAFFLAGFLVVEALGVPWLTTPPPLDRWSGSLAAVIAVGLLVGDAVLPLPASLVILALGGLFGPVVGAALGLTGRVGATLLGFALGRCLVGRVDGADHDRAARLLHRWGAAALVLTRPVPVVGETVAVLAGASRMSWARAIPAAMAGALSEAVLLAWAGAQAGRSVLGTVLWLALVALAGLVCVGDRLHRRDRSVQAGRPLSARHWAGAAMPSPARSTGSVGSSPPPGTRARPGPAGPDRARPRRGPRPGRRSRPKR